MLLPWAVFVGVETILFAFPGGLHDVPNGLGWLGLLGLLASILVPIRTCRAHCWLRALITILLGCGIVADVVLLTRVRASPEMEGWWILWLFGGPLIVAFWNLLRMWERAEPVATDNPDDAQ